MSKKRVDVALPLLGEEELEALRSPLETGWLAQGPQVAAFEAAFAQRHDVAHGIAVTSCTTGLHLALLALGVGEGDEVVVPAFTFVATANAVLYCGAKPVFVDVDPSTYNMDAAHVAKVITKRTKAVMPVHVFGLCADVDTLRTVVPEHLPIVEDAACAAGAALGERPAGGLGETAVFSFHPRKIITTGEGGMITTNDDELAKNLRRLRNHGAQAAGEDRHRGTAPWLLPDYDELGYNYRMSDIQAAIGRAQLARLDGMLKERRQMAQRYEKDLASIEWLTTPAVLPSGVEHSWQSYVVVVNEEVAPASRNEIMARLDERGISTRPGTHAVPDLGWYRKSMGITPGSFQVASRLAACSMAIPLHNRMSETDYERVVEALHNI